MLRLFRCFRVLLVLLLVFGARGFGALRLEASAGGWDAAHERNTRNSLANARGESDVPQQWPHGRRLGMTNPESL
jgi:hypothetical protein